MSATTTPHAPQTPQGPLPQLEEVGPVPFHRLVRIELRKAVDTRAGFWLLLTMSVISLVVVGAFAVFGPEGEKTFATYLGLTSLPLLTLLPIVGIMAATQEWSARTGLVTFTLEPRRALVVAAKLVAAVGLALVVTAAAFAAAALVTAASGGQYSLEGISAGGMVLAFVVVVLQGAGFGLAFLNTPFAIVASLVLPTLWTLATSLVSALQDVAPWLDLGRTTDPLTTGSMDGEAWAQLATSSLMWVALPIAIGTWRVLTREVK